MQQVLQQAAPMQVTVRPSAGKDARPNSSNHLRLLHLLRPVRHGSCCNSWQPHGAASCLAMLRSMQRLHPLTRTQAQQYTRHCRWAAWQHAWCCSMHWASPWQRCWSSIGLLRLASWQWQAVQQCVCASKAHNGEFLGWWCVIRELERCGWSRAVGFSLLCDQLQTGPPGAHRVGV